LFCADEQEGALFWVWTYARTNLFKTLTTHLSMENTDLEKMLHTIRLHWDVENTLHWILDTFFGKDQSRIRKGNAPENMAIIRHTALNMLQKAKQKTDS